MRPELLVSSIDNKCLFIRLKPIQEILFDWVIYEKIVMRINPFIIHKNCAISRDMPPFMNGSYFKEYGVVSKILYIR